MSKWLTSLANTASNILDSVDEYASNSIHNIVTYNDDTTTTTTTTTNNINNNDNNNNNISSDDGRGEYLRATNDNSFITETSSSSSTTNNNNNNSNNNNNNNNSNDVISPLTEIPLDSPQYYDNALLYQNNNNNNNNNNNILYDDGTDPPPPPTYSSASIDNLSSENDALRSEVLKLRHSVAELTSTNNKYSTDYTNLDRVYRESVASSRQLSSDVSLLQAQLADRSNQLEANRMQIEVLRNQCQLYDASLLRNTEDEKTITRLRADLSALATAQKVLNTDSMHKISKLETQLLNLTDEKENLLIENDKLQIENNKLSEVQINLNNLIDENKVELSGYRLKANSVLETKENLINSLQNQIKTKQNQIKTQNFENVDSKNFELINSELQQKTENLSKDLLKSESELSALNNKLEDMKSENSQLTSQIKQKTGQISALEFEADNNSRNLQHQMETMRNEYQITLNLRDRKVQELQTILSNASKNPSITPTDVEFRIRSLTDTVIQKQRSLESLSTENSALLLKIERMQSTSTTHKLLSDPADKYKAQYLPIPVNSSTIVCNRNVYTILNRLDEYMLYIANVLKMRPYARLAMLFHITAIHVLLMYILLL